MGVRTIERVGAAKKCLLTAAAAAALAVPLVFGLSTTPAAAAGSSARADAPSDEQAGGQTGAQAIPTPAEIAQRRYEQARPRTEVPFDPGHFDRYAGWYELSPTVFLHVTRDGSHYFAQMTGQPKAEIYPQSATEFFLKIVPGQVSFDVDTQGRVTGLVLHQGGLLQPAPKVDQQTAAEADAALQARIKRNMPSSGTEAVVRHWIAAKEKGQTDEANMAPNLAAIDRIQQPIIRRMIEQMGPLKSLAFERVNKQGSDVYLASFARGQLEFIVAPLAPDGKITGLGVHPPF